MIQGIAKRIATGLLTLASATLIAIMMSSCEQPPATDDSGMDVGEITAELQLEPGVSLNLLNYAITGPSSFTKNGTINLQASAASSAVIGPLPRGTGFGLTLTGTASDATTTCAGSATFNVVAGQTTPVVIHLLCHELPRLGSVRISGVFNTCPRVDGVSASPKQLAVGATSMLGVAAHDADAGPSALAYHWSSNSGTLSGADVQSPSFTCTSVGTAHVTVTASDGDPLPSCAGSASVDIRCTGP